jgi:hypothetical protein
MNPDELKTQLETMLGGQTLATFRAEAAKEMNGTAFRALRSSDGRRWLLIICITGARELGKFPFPADRSTPFGDWASVALVEAVGKAARMGRLIYDFEINPPNSTTAAVLISADPCSTEKLAAIFNLPP